MCDPEAVPSVGCQLPQKPHPHRLNSNVAVSDHNEALPLRLDSCPSASDLSETLPELAQRLMLNSCPSASDLSKTFPRRLNSNASASDLSEAASDMSLSTSPGSDMPGQSSKGCISVSTSPPGTTEISSRPPQQSCSSKRSLVRKLSSNPYTTSSEMSPSEDHPHIVGTHSYAVGESRLYDKMEDIADVSFPECFSHVSSHHRVGAHPITSDCPGETDEEDDDDEEEDDSSNDDKQKGQIGLTLDYSPENNDGIKNISTMSGCQSQIENCQHVPCTQVFSPGTLSSSTEVMQVQHHNHQQQHQEQQYNHINHYRHYLLQQQHFYSNSNVYPPISNASPVNGLGYKINGYECHRNENDIYSMGSEVHGYTGACDDLHHDSVGPVSGTPKSRKINSWGHFHKPSESNYRYRRSHYSSDSDEEDSPGSSKAHPKQISNRLSTYKSHLCHCDPTTPSQAPIIHRNNVHRNQTRISTERQIWTHNGIKPQEFKERFVLMKKWFSECNDGQKNLVMKGLLSLCELPQLHLLSVHMSKELHHGCPSNCEDIITWLPRDLALKVMSYLDPVSLCHAAQVCRVWRQLAEDQSLWCRFCCQTKWRLSKAAEHKQVISHMCPEGSIQWKNVFAERFRLRNNWLKGRCSVRTFEGHMQGISCVQFDDSRIVSGSSDKTIKVWNMRTNAPWSVQTLMGHHGTVRCLYLEGNRLVSGSCDKTIKVWDLSTQESWSSIACKVTMTGHTDTVRCLQADDDKVISGSYDTTLKIWDVKSGALRRTLRGHQASVLCVHFSETKIVSGSADKTIKVWNYDGHCVMTLCGHQDAVTCLMFDSTRIVSGSLDHNLKFWDIHTGECLNTIDWKKAEGHTDVVRCLQADSWRVVSAADDKTIKVWNLATGERLVTLRNHTDGVTCLQFNDFIIVSGSYDKSVKLWDFSCC